MEIAQVKLMMKYGLVAYQPDPFGLIKGVRVDRDEQATEKKWRLIEGHLPATPYSALDIGCNIGFFSFKLAMSGADHVVALETERGPLMVAEKLKTISRVGNVGFCTLTITEENVQLLGEYDVILLLSVFHHLVYSRDLETAKRILRVLITKTRKVMFFETGQGDQGFGRMAQAMPTMEARDVQRFIEGILYDCGEKSVEKLGETLLAQEANRGLYKVVP